MLVRISIAAASGTAVTFGLLFVMQLMVATGRTAVTGSVAYRVTDFVRVAREQIVETRERKPDKVPEPAAQPERVTPQRLPDFDSAALAVGIDLPDVAPRVATNALGFGLADGEMLPIVKVAAAYPQRALVRRLEGHVLVEFTVTTTGAVKDVIVVESTDTVFETSAIEAALRFKYKPRVVDGAPVEVRGVRNMIVFALEA